MNKKLEARLKKFKRDSLRLIKEMRRIGREHEAICRILSSDKYGTTDRKTVS